MVWKIECISISSFFVTNPQILLLRVKWQTKCMIVICIRVNLFVCYENDSLINFKALDLSFHTCKRSEGDGGRGGEGWGDIVLFDRVI